MAAASAVASWRSAAPATGEPRAQLETMCALNGLKTRGPDEDDAGHYARIRDVIAWVEARQDQPDMGEVINYMFEDGLISGDFALGPVPTTFLFNAWAQRMRHGVLVGDNELASLRHELEVALATEEGLPWVLDLQAKMADLIAWRSPRH